MKKDKKCRQLYWNSFSPMYSIAERKKLGLWDNLSEEDKRYFTEREKRAASPEYKAFAEKVRQEWNKVRRD